MQSCKLYCGAHSLCLGILNANGGGDDDDDDDDGGDDNDDVDDAG